MNIQEKVAEIMSLDKYAAVGPLRASLILVQMFEQWDLWKAEAGGDSPEAWCRRTFASRGYHISVRRRAEAVDVALELGFSKDVVLSRFHWQTLVYVCGPSVKPGQRVAALNAVLSKTKSEGVPTLSLGVAMGPIREAIGEDATSPKSSRMTELLAWSKLANAELKRAGIICPLPAWAE